MISAVPNRAAAKVWFQFGRERCVLGLMKWQERVVLIWNAKS